MYTSIEIRRQKRKFWGSNHISSHHLSNTRIANYRQAKIALQRNQSFSLQTPRWSDSESFLHHLQQSIVIQDNNTIRKPISFVPVHLIPQDTIQRNWQSFRDTFEQTIDCLEHDSVEEILSRQSFLQHYQKEENWIFSLEQDEREDFDTPPLTLVTQREAFRWSLQQLFIRASKLEQPPQGFVFTRVELWPLSILRDVQEASKRAFSEMNKPIPVIFSGAIPIEGEERNLHLQDYTMQEMLDDLKIEHPTKELRQALFLSGGIPQLYHSLRKLQRNNSNFRPSEAQLRQEWSFFVKEIRIIFNLLSAQRQLYNRILRLARKPLLTNSNDQVLAEVGLVKKVGLKTHIRSPIMSRIFLI
jgi:hypothetical protein